MPRDRRTAATLVTDGKPVEYEGLGTMSKSRNNGVDPQGFVQKYGADTARLFMMFTSPPEQTLEWSDEGAQGAFRFLRRLWKAVFDHVNAAPTLTPLDLAALAPAGRELRAKAHQTLAKVTDDIGRRRTFNTAIASVMELLNAVGRFDAQDAQAHALRQEALEIAVMCLSPVIPHVCHALWHELGHDGALIDERWRTPDPAALAQDSVEVIVQVNGKLRGRVSVPSGADEATMRTAALGDANVQRFLGDAPPRRVIVVPGKLVNIVV